MIDLLHPDPSALLKKWEHIIAQTASIFTWTNSMELAWLAEYATRATNLLEIGSYNGRSAKVMLLANPTLLLTSCDTWDDSGTFEAYQHNLAPEIAEGRVKFHRGPSQVTVPNLQDRFTGSFVDGGHEARLVALDVQNVLVLMEPGSLMAGHDFRGNNDVADGLRSAIGDKFQNPCESIWVFSV